MVWPLGQILPSKKFFGAKFRANYFLTGPILGLNWRKFKQYKAVRRWQEYLARDYRFSSFAARLASQVPISFLANLCISLPPKKYFWIRQWIPSIDFKFYRFINKFFCYGASNYYVEKRIKILKSLRKGETGNRLRDNRFPGSLTQQEWKVSFKNAGRVFSYIGNIYKLHTPFRFSFFFFIKFSNGIERSQSWKLYR